MFKPFQLKIENIKKFHWDALWFTIKRHFSSLYAHRTSYLPSEFFFTFKIYISLIAAAIPIFSEGILRLPCNIGLMQLWDSRELK